MFKRRTERAFQTWATKRGVAAVGQALDHDWERLVTFYQFPKAHWKHLRTTNPIESPFAAVRLRTTAAKRFKRVENATAVIWKTLLIAERTFRRLDAPELLAEVAEGARTSTVCDSWPRRSTQLPKAWTRQLTDLGRHGRPWAES